MTGQPLTPADLAGFARSGISEETTKAANLRRVDSFTGGNIVGRNGSGNYEGIIFPYVWPGTNHVREYRLRRDNPEIEVSPGGVFKGKNKYLSPPGARNMLYFVQICFAVNARRFRIATRGR